MITKCCLCLIVILNIALTEVNAAEKQQADFPYMSISSRYVKISDGFWAARLETNRSVTIPHLLRMNEENNRLNNLRKGAGLMEGPYQSRRYNDTDVYKLLEAIGFSLMMYPDPELERIADEQIEIIAKAQQPDGYLFPALTIDPNNPAPGVGPGRWDSLNGSHELYNMGHMMEAAVAYYQATGKRRFLDVAVKCADMLCNTFGPDKRRATSGHEEIEVALPKMYRVTGNRKYIDLLKFLIDQRGHEHQVTDYGPGSFAMYNDRWYRQDDKPVVEQTRGQGHAVRATYLYAGLTDLAALTGDKQYIDATNRIWESVVGCQMYVMGGVGSVGGTEAFGEDYVLPNSPSYCESCAAIGNALWNERLFRLNGEAKYIDVMERIVYNGILTGISLRGDSFFYQNPQEQGIRGRRGRGRRRTDTDADQGPRRSWFDVACCPANLSRFVAQFPGYIYATHNDTLYVNFFVDCEADIDLKGRKIKVTQETDYPWQGVVKLTLAPETEGMFTVNIRIPGWSQGHALPTDLYTFLPSTGMSQSPGLKINGQDIAIETIHGYASLNREWKKGDTVELNLPMPARRLVAHDKVEADRGLVALQRGPLVYCVEGTDNGDRTASLHLPDNARLTVEHRSDLLGGVSVIKANVDSNEITAIPYQMWGNRGSNPMRIWIPREASQPDADNE